MTWQEEFDKKFLYWVVLGSTLNDGSELRWNVGEGKMPSIDDVKSFIQKTREDAVREAFGEVEEILNRHAEWTPTCGHGGDEEKGYQKGLIEMAKLIQYEVLSIIQKHKVQ